MNGSEARARVDAFFDARDRAELERAEGLQRSLELRDAAWAGEPAADLAAMGIDSANLRWLAARNLIRKGREAANRRFERIWLVATFLDAAELNAIRRGEVVGDAGHDLIIRDYLEAKCIILARYAGVVRERAGAIIDCYLPDEAHSASPGPAYRAMKRELADDWRDAR